MSIKPLAETLDHPISRVRISTQNSKTSETNVSDNNMCCSIGQVIIFQLLKGVVFKINTSFCKLKPISGEPVIFILYQVINGVVTEPDRQVNAWVAEARPFPVQQKNVILVSLVDHDLTGMEVAICDSLIVAT